MARLRYGIPELAARYGLSSTAETQLATLLDLLLEDEAPTAIRDRRRAIEDHLADSLVALELPVVREASRIVDLGSGAGLPGLPLAIALPASEVVLVEAASRKCAFIERAIEASGIRNATVRHARAEEHAVEHPEYDLVAVRAVASLAVIAEYAAPLLRTGGTLVAWRGRRDSEAEAEGERAAQIVGLQVQRVQHVEPYPGAHDRYLHLMSKVRETPERFPRRPGMAVKRPLGR